MVLVDFQIALAESVRLNEYTQIETWDLTRQTLPQITWEEFEVMWLQQLAWKAARRFH